MKIKATSILGWLVVPLAVYSAAAWASSEFSVPWTKLHFESVGGEQATIVASQNADSLLSLSFQDGHGHQFSVPEACLKDIYSPELSTTRLVSSVGLDQVAKDKWVASNSFGLTMKFGVIKPGENYGDPKDAPIVRFMIVGDLLAERDVIQEKDGQYLYGKTQVLDLTKQSSPDKCGVESKPGRK
ncbi:MAG TPA: hypothetical protein VGM16_00105 [Gammaproteobacteria bacterium]|jgi:hypothetical protein